MTGEKLSGISSNTVSQSMTSPVSSAVAVSTQSSISDIMQPWQMCSSSETGGSSQGLPPRSVVDEGSEASNTAVSSSLPEELVEIPKPNSKLVMSHPQTSKKLLSPGGASMSSFHDELESVSNPSCSNTPASPVTDNQTCDHHLVKRPEGMLQLYDLSDDPDRRLFLDKLIMYQEERGTPLSQCPTISKQPLDLYKLYLIVKERGGFVEVMTGRMWKEISEAIGLGASSSAAYTLRKQYIKHLLPYECKFDRGGADPGLLVSTYEGSSRKRNAHQNADSELNVEGTSDKENTDRFSAFESNYVEGQRQDEWPVYLNGFRMDSRTVDYAESRNGISASVMNGRWKRWNESPCEMETLLEKKMRFMESVSEYDDRKDKRKREIHQFNMEKIEAEKEIIKFNIEKMKREKEILKYDMEKKEAENELMRLQIEKQKLKIECLKLDISLKRKMLSSE